ncbi:MAG: hypothetical protein JM57_02550 [Comamonadaceae bacterium BICA1-1]|nr:MAG: hypothetical protein JM57_02550 [Comamonadaceae bacterium BICA1-1]
MVSITAMKSATLRDETSIASMVCTTCRTDSPPRPTTAEAVCASASAERACAAFCPTTRTSSMRPSWLIWSKKVALV